MTAMPDYEQGFRGYRNASAADQQSAPYHSTSQWPHSDTTYYRDVSEGMARTADAIEDHCRQSLIDRAVRNCRKEWDVRDGNVVLITRILDDGGLHEPQFCPAIRAEFRRLSQEVEQ